MNGTLPSLTIILMIMVMITDMMKFLTFISTTMIKCSSKTTQLNRKQLRALLSSTRGEPVSIKHEHKWLVGILDDKYEAANLDKLVA